jgi:hypothetical protein
VDRVSLKTVQADAQYRGAFQEFAFGLLTNPTPLYRGLLKHLAPYGAKLDQLRIDAATVSEAQVVCALWDINASVNVRLDRLEVTYFRLHEIWGTAVPVLVACWNAVQEADATISLASHLATVNVTAAIQGVSYESLMERYVRLPEAAGLKARAGVVFYFPGKGDYNGGSVTIDRIGPSEDRLILRTTLGFDATRVPPGELGSRVIKPLTQYLDLLGLELVR